MRACAAGPPPRLCHIRSGGANAVLDPALMVYDAQLAAESMLAASLDDLNPTATLLLYTAGLLTSLSPCALSALPLTVGLIAAMDSEKQKNTPSFIPAFSFVLGLACALTASGASAALLGSIYGQSSASSSLPLIAAILTATMGLNLLDLLPLQLPGLDAMEAAQKVDNLPPSLQAFALGAGSAFLSSPCTSPVLAAILSFVATTGDPFVGGFALLIFTLGYTTPVLGAGIFASVGKGAARAAGRFNWVPRLSGGLLLTIGTYSSLNIIAPL